MLLQSYEIVLTDNDMRSIPWEIGPSLCLPLEAGASAVVCCWIWHRCSVHFEIADTAGHSLLWKGLGLKVDGKTKTKHEYRHYNRWMNRLHVLSSDYLDFFYLQLLVKGLWSTAQVHRWHKLLHGRQLSICQLTILGSDPIHNQSEFLLLQAEYDLRQHSHQADE